MAKGKGNGVWRGGGVGDGMLKGRREGRGGGRGEEGGIVPTCEDMAGQMETLQGTCTM